ncbi:hypothetical protein PIB30_063349 [Stylosanthes scabra]|uniref:RRM domain-containing protein n=1 Tax=Stylosanthes scabra TaxID=79078 RepID=A0ABU6ZK48_9FABA|nr:hypothetical protein [Stylosanthes scabra]
MRENQKDGEGANIDEWQQVRRGRSRATWCRTNPQPHLPTHSKRFEWNWESDRWAEQRRNMEANTVRVFVDNLPRNTMVRWLWNIFGKEGKIVDIFLQRKERKWNPLRFAFVRFETRTEEHTAIRRLHGQEFWECNLALSEAKYRKNEERDLKRTPVEIQRREPIATHASARRSFRDVVANDQRNDAFLC